MNLHDLPTEATELLRHSIEDSVASCNVALRVLGEHNIRTNVILDPLVERRATLLSLLAVMNKEEQ